MESAGGSGGETTGGRGQFTGSETPTGPAGLAAHTLMCVQTAHRGNREETKESSGLFAVRRRRVKVLLGAVLQLHMESP